ncbi:hydrogenase nickel incorporation protein HypA/HybF [Parelusimicrobium proximum]|uniref:hydrogenase nickel incorporation protein HypA n=1 Tax=Parelusimicrobium proximum TaxID=3228953 RepID=UPI003D18375B
MHEWALSDSVAHAAAAIKKEQNFNKIDKIVVVLGSLQNIAPKVFKEIFDEVKKQHEGIEDTEMALEFEDAELKCNVCGTEFPLKRDELSDNTLESIHFVPETARLYIKCPKCASADFAVIKGRGLYIKEVEGSK